MIINLRPLFVVIIVTGGVGNGVLLLVLAEVSWSVETLHCGETTIDEDEEGLKEDT